MFAGTIRTSFDGIGWNAIVESESVLTVSQLTDAVRQTLNGEFAKVWVSGEISGLSRPQSGHIYLTLKDDLAQLSGVVWRTLAQKLPFDPTDGIQVLCRGYIDVYPQRGSYQLIIQSMQPLGLGALQLAFRQLHDRLKREGLFADQAKKPLPKIPRRIVVITSPTGAAIQDFLHVATRRWPHLDVLIVPVKVQGPDAAGQIASAVKMCGDNFSFNPDVIVVTRGGGSIEDLWAFNEEQVIRAIFECPIPVVSAVGHEIDITLCDLVADLRALTPSEAGEKLVPNILETRQALADFRYRLANSTQRQLDRYRELLGAIARRQAVRQPLQFIQRLAQQLDSSETKLSQFAVRKFEFTRQNLGHFFNILRMAASQWIPNSRRHLEQLVAVSALGRPEKQIRDLRGALQLSGRNLATSMADRMKHRNQRLELLDGKLNAFDPTRVLQRGYSLTVDGDGKPIVSCHQVRPHDTIRTW